MKLTGSIAATALVLALSACSKPANGDRAATSPATHVAKVDTAAVAEAVKADVAGLVAAFNARDAAKAVSYDAPDYVGMMHGVPNVIGPEADLIATKAQVSDPNAKLAVSDESVDVAASGDLAVYRATYAYTFTDAKTKTPSTETGNWVLVFKAQPDGARKISLGVISDLPAPKP
jgi:ketosteroid isomerase-like protein